VTIDLDVAAQDLRRRLADKDFLALAHMAPPGVALRTQQEMEGTLYDILAQRDADEDLHVFGYGSLMWNPGVVHSALFRAKVHGWHRRFCLRCVIGRGAPDTPGLMLALDRGGSCNGMLIRIPAGAVVDEMSLLWRREMSWGSYQARWVTAWVDGAPVRAVTFVVDRQHPRYLGDLPLHDAARLIDTGHGRLGTCRAYFDATMQRLRELGIEDRGMALLALYLANSS
jgi:cation transport protein ChaC